MASPMYPKASANSTDRSLSSKTGTSRNRMPMNDSFDHPEVDASALPAPPAPIHGTGPDSERVRDYGSPDLKRNDTTPSARFNIWWSLGGAVARRWYLLIVVALGLGA